MAVTATQLTANASNTNATSYATASVSPAADTLILISVYSRKTADATGATITGNGLTWVSVVAHEDSGNSIRHEIFRSMGSSPSSGAITIDFGAKTQELCAWNVTQFNNVDTSGTNGSGAVGNSAGNIIESAGNTGLTITLAAFGSVNNATYGSTRAGNTIVEGSGFTELAEVSSATDVPYFQAEWKNSNDTSVDWTWASSDSFGLGVACEIVAAEVAGGAVSHLTTLNAG